MTLPYGIVKCTLAGPCRIQSARHKSEIQYHLHAPLQVATAQGPRTWDVAVNVGTNDADDLLRYRLVYDFHHPIITQLDDLQYGLTTLTDTKSLPALDFLRSDILAETGNWRDSDVMDGATDREPYRSLARLLDGAPSGTPVYFVGRLYNTGDGLHDIHMNQGSTGSFLNRGDDHNDHNDIWQDGGVIVEMPGGTWAAYFTAFTQQAVPTDDMGNPKPGAHEIQEADDGSLVPAEAAGG